MATELAFSPAIAMSADSTGPQVSPSANRAHSTTALPLPSFCCGSESVKADAKTRRPDEPVSTRTPLIDWHCELPGTQTATKVNALSLDLTSATASVTTLMVCTFWVLLLLVCVLVDDDPELPQPESSELAQAESPRATTSILRQALGLIGSPPAGLRRAPTAAR